MPINLKRPASLIFSMVIIVVWAFFPAGSCQAGPVATGAVPLVQNGGYVVTRGDEPIFQFNADTQFIPASTLKIATALAALELLGPSYRFKTEFYLRAPDLLCIKGYGDPYLVSEQVAAIAHALKKKGLQQVGGIILDDSFFDVTAPPDGSSNSSNPYDAINSALSVNFNTVPLIKYDSGAIASPEPQTPLLPISRDIAPYLEPGIHRVNVSSFTQNDPAITHHRYVAELFAQHMTGQGITTAPRYRTGTIRGSDTLIYTYHSEKTLAGMIRGCLKYSNNFIANQLFLSSGAAQSGAPATWTKSRSVLSSLLPAKTGISPAEFTMVEGSGLSSANRVTPAAMIKLLDAFKPYAHLLSEKNGVLLKSGTLTGVYAYAGYFRDGDALDPFALVLNQKNNSRDALLTRLEAIHRQSAARPTRLTPEPAVTP